MKNSKLIMIIVLVAAALLLILQNTDYVMVKAFLFPFGDAHDSFAAYLYRDWFSSWTAGGAQGKAEIEISTNLHYTD
jgi:hypothetical protein